MNLSEINWDIDSAGTWPFPIKVTTVLLACAIVTGLWVYFDAMDQVASLEAVEKKEQELKQSFEVKQKKAVNLNAYKQQLKDMEESFGEMLRQLPDRTEVANLLVDVSQTGLASGLEFELFKPQSELKKEFYIELPIEVRVVGDFVEFGTFVSGLASLPRIVTIHNVKLAPSKDSDKMVMEAVVKTYSYLDENDEAETIKTTKKDKKRGKKRGKK